MILALGEGLFFGLLLSVMIGPVFFTLLQTSLNQGLKKGLAVALGASSSDLIILTAAVFGLINVSPGNMEGKFIGLIGVLVLMTTGILMIRNKGLNFAPDEDNRSSVSFIRCYMKGFLINSMNPFVFIFWLGVTSFTSSKYHHDHVLILSFILGAFLAVFFTDLLKIYLSGQLKVMLHTSLIGKISVIIGTIIIVYSLQLFWQIM